MAVQILHQDSHAPGGIDLISDPDAIAVGDATMRRRDVSSAAVALGTSGTLRLAFFTARLTETVTQLRMMTGATPAAATPTLCRAGIWTVAANGDITLVGSIANDTALFAAASTAYTRSLVSPSSFIKVAGQRYAIGLLVVSATTMPSFTGQSNLNSAEAIVLPRLAGSISSLSDLPTGTTASASIGGSGSIHYSVILP